MGLLPYYSSVLGSIRMLDDCKLQCLGLPTVRAVGSTSSPLAVLIVQYDSHWSGTVQHWMAFHKSLTRSIRKAMA